MSGAPDPDLRAVAKRLLRATRITTLATLGPGGGPFASLTAIATLPDGSPLLLLSRLAQHTENLGADARCSLLLAEPGRGDPLAHSRLTLVGFAHPLAADDQPEGRRRFLARNPKAALYADFPDFGFYRFAIDAAHLNGGFARAARFSPTDILTDIAGCEDLIRAEDGAVAHMNSDHRDAVRLYATRLLSLPDRDWQLSGLDPEGLDLVWGDSTGRLAFPERVTAPDALRATLVGLASDARAAGG